MLDALSSLHRRDVARSRIATAALALAVTVVIGLAAQAGAVAPAGPAALAAAGLDPRAPDVFRARFDTSQGAFEVEVHRAWAPHGADRFHALVAAGFFDDSRFFRVVAGYIAQFGIAGDPAMTAAWKDRPIPDDGPVPTGEPGESGSRGNRRGAFAFAMTGPGTRTTQLYINLKDNRQRLDGQGFAPLGEVIAGTDVVDRLYSGYGEDSGGGMRAGKQAKMLAGGNAWLDAQFPRLDHLIRVRLLEGTP